MARRTLPCRSRDRQPAAKPPIASGPERTSPRRSPRSAPRSARQPRRSTVGPNADCHLPNRLQQFDAVAERIIDVCPGVRRPRLVVTDRDPGRPQALDEEPQALHDKGGMSLAGRAEVGINTEVDLDALVLESAAPSPLQIDSRSLFMATG